MLFFRRALLAFSILFAIDASSAQGGPPTQSSKPTFSISLTADKDINKVGSEVRVKATVTNISNSKIALGRSMDDRGEFEFAIDVHNDKGTVPPLTEYGRGVIKHEIPVMVPYGGYSNLQPGETFKSELIVTKLFELSPGKYTVQLERTEESTLRIIKSNSVSVTVTP